jgi:aspartokinase-like uncharacterized kinase
MANDVDEILLADPVLSLIYSGRAKDLDEAEEMYLDESIPEILILLEMPMSNEALEQHPLMQLLYQRRMRGREDSLL